VTPLTALTIAGVGLAAKGLGNIISGVGSLFSNSNGSTTPTDPSRSVEAPNGETPAATDAIPITSTGTAVGSVVGENGPIQPGAGNATAVTPSGNAQGVSGAGISALGPTGNAGFGLGGITASPAQVTDAAKAADNPTVPGGEPGYSGASGEILNDAVNPPVQGPNDYGASASGANTELAGYVTEPSAGEQPAPPADPQLQQGTYEYNPDTYASDVSGF
jgi:hypothetical protein